MTTPNTVLMDQAREALRGKWRLGVKVTALYTLITFVSGSIPVVGFFAQMAIIGPLMLGLTHVWLKLARNETPVLNEMFSGFDTWLRAVKAYFLMGFYILLWALLLIIPGIIAAFAYSQTYFILAEDKDIRVRDALKKSKAMMRGHKWKLFCLHLRFIGWALLCILTLGIGFLWLMPYISTTNAKFYDDIKNNQLAA